MSSTFCYNNLFPPASAASWGVTKPLLIVSDHFCSLFNGTPITFIHFLTQLTSQICWLSENFPKIQRSAKRSSRTSLQNACGGILIFLFFHNRFLHNSLRDLPFFRKSQYWRFQMTNQTLLRGAGVKNKPTMTSGTEKGKKLPLHIFCFQNFVTHFFRLSVGSFSKVVKSEKLKI